jgi:DNA-binding phage protein
MAYHHTKVELKAAAFAAMKELVNDKKLSNRNIKVAAINAIGLLNIGGSSDAEKTLLDEALTCLETYYMEPLGAGEQLIQAHCPTAIAKLIGRDHAKTAKYKELFASDLQEKNDKRKAKISNDTIYQSCALALGQLAKPYTDKDVKNCPDAEYSKLLLDQWHNHKDAQTRNFSVLSLGFIGGSENLKVLLKELDKGTKNQQKPWCALSLGVYSFFVHEQSKKGNPAEDLSLVNEALFTCLKATNEPSLTGALAIALGLSQTLDAADVMRERMRENVAKEQMAGYLAIGLALMNDGRSLEDIRNVVDSSIRRTELLQQAAIALGKLGDKRVAEQLLKHLTEGEPNLAKLSAVASALGFIGDARTVVPLKKMLFDENLGPLSRAFAAVALGGVADKEPLPWNSKIGTNMNYRASVETLTNRSSGILDIL